MCACEDAEGRGLGDRAEGRPGRVCVWVGKGTAGRVGCTVWECVWVAQWNLGGGVCGRVWSVVAVPEGRCESNTTLAVCGGWGGADLDFGRHCMAKGMVSRCAGAPVHLHTYMKRNQVTWPGWVCNVDGISGRGQRVRGPQVLYFVSKGQGMRNSRTLSCTVRIGRGDVLQMKTIYSGWCMPVRDTLRGTVSARDATHEA